MKIAVIGLGKLGSVIAAVYAAAGHEVVGVDVNPTSVADINNGRAPVLEPGLQELIDQAGVRLKATTDVATALIGAEASYLIVPTPSDHEGSFTNDYVIRALTEIGQALRNSDIRHTVIICSTVMPGSCDGVLKEALESTSGKKVGADLGLVYSPEFIALGSVVKNMHYPDVILIGESDDISGNVAQSNALSVVKNAPVVQRMNMVNAEIVKISINTFVTTKISFANMLGEICDRMPGGDVDVVTAAVGSDSRIGTKYLKGALGYGGPCFPRDNVALTRLADSLGIDAAIPRATDAINDRQVFRVVELVKAQVPVGETVAVLGLAYKPDTPVCERSQGVDIANQLVAAGFSVIAHDPQANSTTAPYLHPEIEFDREIKTTIARATGVVVATAWPEFAQLTKGDLKNKFVVDAWGVLPDDVSTARLGKLQSANNTDSREKSLV